MSYMVSVLLGVMVMGPLVLGIAILATVEVAELVATGSPEVALRSAAKLAILPAGTIRSEIAIWPEADGVVTSRMRIPHPDDA